MKYEPFPRRTDFATIDISMWLPKKNVGWGFTMPDKQSLGVLTDLKFRNLRHVDSFCKRDKDGEVAGMSETYRFVFQNEDGEPPVSTEQIAKWKQALEELFVSQGCVIR